MSQVDIGNLWGDSPVDPEHHPVTKDQDIDPVHLQIHLGHHSSYVGYMDTIDKVREHLAALNHYDTVRANLLGKPVEEAQPTLFGGPVVQQVPEPELSEDERLAIQREAVALINEQQQRQKQSQRIPYNERFEPTGKIVDDNDDVAFARQMWVDACARRDQAEADLREARKWRDEVAEETRQLYRDYLAARGANPPT